MMIITIFDSFMNFAYSSEHSFVLYNIVNALRYYIQPLAMHHLLHKAYSKFNKPWIVLSGLQLFCFIIQTYKICCSIALTYFDSLSHSMQCRYVLLHYVVSRELIYSRSIETKIPFLLRWRFFLNLLHFFFSTFACNVLCFHYCFR